MAALPAPTTGGEGRGGGRRGERTTAEPPTAPIRAERGAARRRGGPSARRCSAPSVWGVEEQLRRSPAPRGALGLGSWGAHPLSPSSPGGKGWGDPGLGSLGMSALRAAPTGAPEDLLGKDPCLALTMSVINTG